MTPAKEWHNKFLSRLTERGLTQDEAWDTLVAGIDDYDYEDDPKDVADEELSYWVD